MYSFQDVDFATETLLDEVFSAGYEEGLEQEFELDDELEQDDLDYLCDSYVEGSLFGWDS